MPSSCSLRFRIRRSTIAVCVVQAVAVTIVAFVSVGAGTVSSVASASVTLSVRQPSISNSSHTPSPSASFRQLPSHRSLLQRRCKIRHRQSHLHCSYTQPRLDGQRFRIRRTHRRRLRRSGSCRHNRSLRQRRCKNRLVRRVSIIVTCPASCSLRFRIVAHTIAVCVVQAVPSQSPSSA